MGTISSEFKGLPMSDLIGGPLLAACDAEVMLANATADFIERIGFEPPTEGQPVGAPRTASFRFTRPTPAIAEIPEVIGQAAIQHQDAVPATNTQAAQAEVPAQDEVLPQAAVAGVPAGTETVALDVPLLAIVPIPALSIKGVDIVFDMEVKSSASTRSSTDEAASLAVEASARWAAVKVKVNIQGSIATHKENTSSTDTSAKYHVEVHASDTGMPEGLRRVLDIMNSAIVPVPVPVPLTQ